MSTTLLNDARCLSLPAYLPFHTLRTLDVARCDKLVFQLEDDPTSPKNGPQVRREAMQGLCRVPTLETSQGQSQAVHFLDHEC